MRGIQAQVKLAHQLADMYCQGRWVAVGGGGYDLYRVVTPCLVYRLGGNVWTDNTTSLPEKWVARWQRYVWSGGAEAQAQQAMG